MGGPFADQMSALQGGAGRYKVDVSPTWNCPVVPQGGVMTAQAVNAMVQELADDAARLRSATTVFAAPVPAGPVEVTVTVLRRGRSMSQLMADVRAPGAEAGHTTIAVFGGDRPGFEFTDLVMPDVPPPEDCPSFHDPDPDGGRLEVAFWQQTEGRPALGNAPWDDYVPTTSECATWYRFDEPPMRADGILDPLAVLSLCDLQPGSVGQRMGPGTVDWAPPSADLTVHLLGDARSEWLLGHGRAHHAGDGYASVAVDLWDATGQLVAHATQVMFLVFPDGPPVGDQRLPADRKVRGGAS